MLMALAAMPRTLLQLQSLLRLHTFLPLRLLPPRLPPLLPTLLPPLLPMLLPTLLPTLLPPLEARFQVPQSKPKQQELTRKRATNEGVTVSKDARLDSARIS